MTTPLPLVHVVDDDERFRRAILRLLKAAGYETRGYSSAGDLLLAKPADSPGCIILDVRMPGINGLDLQRILGATDDTLPIIFLTGHGDIPMSVRAMKAGAVDFLTKPVRKEVLLTAIEAALARDLEGRSAHMQASTLRQKFESLTPREQEVLTLVASGKLNKQIAAELAVSERTVKAHRARVMEKLGVASVAELVRCAVRIARSS